MSESGLLDNVENEYPDYLRDESRRTGTAQTISFPETEEDVRRQLAQALEQGQAVTLQGARTGITAGAVPAGGHILNLSRMCRVTGLRRAQDRDEYVLSVQPGLVLADLREAVRTREFDTAGWSPESLAALARLRDDRPFFFAPDPTEVSAAVGGMVACNASGARSFRFGPTRRHVQRVRVLLAGGGILDLARGDCAADGRSFSLSLADGTCLKGDLPSYRMPNVKNAAGYYVDDDMDLLDLFIGSEGTLGVLLELDLRLIPLPPAMWGLAAFFADEHAALAFVAALRDRADDATAAVEFFDSRSLNMLRAQKRDNPAFSELPELHDNWHTAVYVEVLADSEEEAEEAVMAISEIMAECGGNEDDTWLASDARDIERLKDFRHAVPEAVNLLIDQRRLEEPRITKLGTDLAVPHDELPALMDRYHRDLEKAGLEYIVFGHIGDSHVHVNILPRSLREYERGHELYLQWADAVVAAGGTVSAEHGIGKLKRDMLRRMYGDRGLKEMIDLKRVFDPRGRLNPGNLFVDEGPATP